jgi:hypothetical protein
MDREIRESDWKILRQLHPVALDRFCQRILSEVGDVISDTEQNSHARYLELVKLIERRDGELADAFDDLRRSTALLKLVRMQSQRLLTEAELARFSSETRDAVQRLLSIQSTT